MNKLRTTLIGKQSVVLMMSFIVMLAVGQHSASSYDLGWSSSDTHLRGDIPDDSSSPAEDVTELSVAYEAIVPVYKIQVSVIYSSLFQLPILEEIADSPRLDYPLPTSSYLKVLFRTFILPNAP